MAPTGVGLHVHIIIGCVRPLVMSQNSVGLLQFYDASCARHVGAIQGPGWTRSSSCSAILTVLHCHMSPDAAIKCTCCVLAYAFAAMPHLPTPFDVGFQF